MKCIRGCKCSTRLLTFSSQLRLEDIKANIVIEKLPVQEQRNLKATVVQVNTFIHHIFKLKIVIKTKATRKHVEGHSGIGYVQTCIKEYNIILHCRQRQTTWVQ